MPLTLHFRRVQGIDLGSALTLILRQHAPGEAQRPGEISSSSGSGDASPDVADDVALDATAARHADLCVRNATLLRRRL